MPKTVKTLFNKSTVPKIGAARKTGQHCLKYGSARHGKPCHNDN